MSPDIGAYGICVDWMKNIPITAKGIMNVNSTDEIELRKWCIQQATIVTPNGASVLDAANEIYAWVTSSTPKTAPLREAA